jgi:hypothetical protein
MQSWDDERAQKDQVDAQPAQTDPERVHAERADEHQDRADQRQNPSDTHDPARTPPDGPLGAQRTNQGACRCPSVAAGQSLRQLDCTCAWDEVLTAVHLLAYGNLSDDDVIAYAPVVAAMVHDAAYRSRDEALGRRFAAWDGTRASFAFAYGLDRTRIYQLGLHRQ